MRAAAVLVFAMGAANAFAQGSVSVPAPYAPTPTEVPSIIATPLGTPLATPTPGEGPTQAEGPLVEPTPGPPTPTPSDLLRDRFITIPGESEAIERGMTPIDPIATVERRGAHLRGLDRMSGQIVSFDLAVGARSPMERLVVELLACRAPPSNDLNGTMAFVKVWDTKGDTPVEVFSGWMFADSPALNAMDHPRYDLWLLGCEEG